MENTIENVEALLGRKMDKMEKVIFDLQKDEERYEFRVGKDGSLESHIKAAEVK